MTLVLKTDSSVTYVGLYKDGKMQAEKSWESGRELSNQLLEVIKSICDKVAIRIQDLDGIIVYEGPGSYTGLRIGISVANSIGYSLSVPVVSSTGEKWLVDGFSKLNNPKEKYVTPVYGGQPHITTPRK